MITHRLRQYENVSRKDKNGRVKKYMNYKVEDIRPRKKSGLVVQKVLDPETKRRKLIKDNRESK